MRISFLKRKSIEVAFNSVAVMPFCILAAKQGMDFWKICLGSAVVCSVFDAREWFLGYLERRELRKHLRR